MKLLFKQIILNHAPNCLNPILPAYFFAFLVSPAGVGDADFVNPAFIALGEFGDAGGHFRFKTESF